MSDRDRFGLTGYPFSKSAQGKTYFDKTPGYARLQRAFRQLIEDPGLGLLIAEPGVGKTAAMRNLCADLPRPDYHVVYICDTAVAPLDLYRSLAVEVGVRPSHRALVQMLDERGSAPVVVIDEAQHLSDAFLTDLSGFLNFAFDSRDLLTFWLVGHPPLARRLAMQQHAALRTRVAVELRLEPLDRETFVAAVDHAFKNAGATQKILSDPAAEMLFRSSRGVLRTAAKTLRTALRLASEKEMRFLDEHILSAAVEEVAF